MLRFGKVGGVKPGERVATRCGFFFCGVGSSVLIVGFGQPRLSQIGEESQSYGMRCLLTTLAATFCVWCSRRRCHRPVHSVVKRFRG